MMLSLCRDVMNLEQLIQNNTVMGALTRVLQVNYLVLCLVLFVMCHVPCVMVMLKIPAMPMTLTMSMSLLLLMVMIVMTRPL
jgi:hypothetical protein